MIHVCFVFLFVFRPSSLFADALTLEAIDAAKEHCHAEDSERFVPSFPPGRIIHIEVEANAKVWYVNVTAFVKTQHIA